MTNTINRKYEILADDTIWWGDNKLFRIRALRDFADVKKGDLGGYVQYRDSLSHAATPGSGGAHGFSTRAFTATPESKAPSSAG